MNVGVLLIATNRYIEFADSLIDTIKARFLTTESVSIFLFTDQKISRDDVIVCPIAHKPWPYITLERYHTFCIFHKLLWDQDYLFYLDVDMRVEDEVTRAIIPGPTEKLVGTIHPGFIRPKSGTFEHRKESTAFVDPAQTRHYFTGAFNGGETEAFLKMSETIAANIDQDTKNGLIAIWHDESHLNRYFFEHPPKQLLPSYCYPEFWDLPFKRIIVALEKDHEKIRQS